MKNALEFLSTGKKMVRTDSNAFNTHGFFFTQELFFTEFPDFLALWWYLLSESGQKGAGKDPSHRAGTKGLTSLRVRKLRRVHT